MVNRCTLAGQVPVAGDQSDEREICQYLRWELNIDCAIEEMIRKNFVGPIPPTLPSMKKVIQTLPPTANLQVRRHCMIGGIHCHPNRPSPVNSPTSLASLPTPGFKDYCLGPMSMPSRHLTTTLRTSNQ